MFCRWNVVIESKSILIFPLVNLAVTAPAGKLIMISFAIDCHYSTDIIKGGGLLSLAGLIVLCESWSEM